jgi:hypothetical protein
MKGATAAIAAMTRPQIARYAGRTARHGLPMTTPAARGGRGRQPTTF